MANFISLISGIAYFIELPNYIYIPNLNGKPRMSLFNPPACSSFPLLSSVEPRFHALPSPSSLFMLSCRDSVSSIHLLTSATDCGASLISFRRWLSRLAGIVSLTSNPYSPAIIIESNLVAVDLLSMLESNLFTD